MDNSEGSGAERRDGRDTSIACALRAGAAVYNAGHYHAAHDAWEDVWLGLESGTADERLLHGLIQFTAVVYHGTENNWSGAQGLADSAAGYLSAVAPDHRDVAVAPLLAHLRAVAVDPETLERRAPPPIRIAGARLWLDDLALAETLTVAPILAEELESYDRAVVERAIEYAKAEREEGIRTTFIALVCDFVAETDQRPLVYQRLAAHVQRRRRRETDVEGLFE